MKTSAALVTALFALTGFSLMAQQPPTAPAPASPSTQQPPTQPSTAPPAAEPTQNPSAAAPAPPAAEAPATPAVAMSPVNGELITKLDSKTAKTGDNVVVQTKATAKTADGTEIPKGSKLMGHVVAVQSGGASTNSQVALQFDHIQLKGGQSMAVQSQIQSIAPAEGASPASSASAGQPTGAPPSAPSSAMNGANGASRPSGATAAPTGAPAAGAADNGAPAAGTVVATSGKIDIRTTAVPGILLANNVAGQQDPRMAQASSILLGARRDIQLDGGTQMVVGVAAAGGAGAQ